ncbi:uncharacterized protein [Aegilops tauschii subsp. strangulata]|uniref:uncharacterized protein n=1 Tax=Aegilops tauschii subsp. strangulata TaxID=200361 RepID=UPI001ABC73E8|nr:uncharacterized protein LOC120964719 [Aegilops tauschii subsp. strangulata]
MGPGAVKFWFEVRKHLNDSEKSLGGVCCRMDLDARRRGAGAGVLFVAPTGEHLKYVIQMHFPWEMSTNNTAEYEGLLAGLRIAADLGVRKLIVRGDSQLVVRQINKDYQSPLMEAYMDEVRELEERFDGIQE